MMMLSLLLLVWVILSKQWAIYFIETENSFLIRDKLVKILSFEIYRNSLKIKYKITVKITFKNIN